MNTKKNGTLKLFLVFIAMVVLVFVCFCFTAAADSTNATINANKVNVRSEMNTKSVRIGRLNKGDRIEVVEYNDDWCKVSSNLISVPGYVMTEYINMDKSADIPKASGEPDTFFIKTNNNDEVFEDFSLYRNGISLGMTKTELIRAESSVNYTDHDDFLVYGDIQNGAFVTDIYYYFPNEKLTRIAYHLLPDETDDYQMQGAYLLLIVMMNDKYGKSSLAETWENESHNKDGYDVIYELTSGNLQYENTWILDDGTAFQITFGGEDGYLQLWLVYGFSD